MRYRLCIHTQKPNKKHTQKENENKSHMYGPHSYAIK